MPEQPAPPDAGPPTWLHAATWRAMAAARDRAMVLGQDAFTAARDAALALHPALPLPMLADAAAQVAAMPERPATPAPPPMRPAPARPSAERPHHLPGVPRAATMLG